jgi:hypothetical protein
LKCVKWKRASSGPRSHLQRVDLLDQSFDNLASANAFFTNHLINLGSFSEGITDIDLILNETMSSTQGFGFTYAFTAAGFASAVPEPSTWAMMLIGFAGLGFAFRRSAGKRSTVHLKAAI